MLYLVFDVLIGMPTPFPPPAKLHYVLIALGGVVGCSPKVDHFTSSTAQNKHFFG